MEHSVISSDDSKRERTRESLFMGAKVFVGGARVAVSTVVRNLSPGGVMIDSPAGMKEGQEIRIELRNVGDVNGSVAWVRGGRAGLMFDVEINPDAVRSSIKKSTGTVGAARATTKAQPNRLLAGDTIQVILPGQGVANATIEWVEGKRMALSFE